MRLTLTIFENATPLKLTATGPDLSITFQVNYYIFFFHFFFISIFNSSFHLKLAPISKSTHCELITTALPNTSSRNEAINPIR